MDTDNKWALCNRPQMLVTERKQDKLEKTQKYIHMVWEPLPCLPWWKIIVPPDNLLACILITYVLPVPTHSVYIYLNIWYFHCHLSVRYHSFNTNEFMFCWSIWYLHDKWSPLFLLDTGILYTSLQAIQEDFSQVISADFFQSQQAIQKGFFS